MFSTTCINCNNIFKTNYNNNINYCKPCLESKLLNISCNGNKNKKCENIFCKSCYEGSFLSFNKSHCWSDNNNINPRYIPLKSGKSYLFVCDKPECGHIFESKLLNVVTGGTWCSYCSGLKICGNENCKKCFEKSFASTEQGKYWDYEKNIDGEGNLITPLIVSVLVSYLQLFS